MRISNNLPPILDLQEGRVDRNTALEQLRGMARSLVGPEQQIRSGYLRQTQAGAMNVGGIFTAGSKRLAAEKIKLLVGRAYGDSLSPANRNRLLNSIDTYLGRTGGAMGTRSFVKLIASLDQQIPRDDAQAPVYSGERRIDARLSLPDWVSPDKSGEIIKAATLPANPTDTQIRDIVMGLRDQLQSPISDDALKQFQTLALQMKGHWPAFLHFARLMFPSLSVAETVGAARPVGAPQTFVMGDADGSLGRLVLHAMASGVARLPEDKMRSLSKLLVNEVHALEHQRLMSYQSNEKISQIWDEIADALVVQPNPRPGKPACIFLGDILSDRFTNNQQAMSRLIHKLSGVDPQRHDRAVADLRAALMIFTDSQTLSDDQPADTGVRFIAGNHDTQPLLDLDGKDVLASVDDLAFKAQWGGFAHKKLSLVDYQSLLRNCFKAADFSDGVLVTHNGVAKGPQPKHFLIALGNPGSRAPTTNAQGEACDDARVITAKDPQDLTLKMNLAFGQLIALGQISGAISTAFRPKDEHMTPAALGFLASGFRQVHGHNDDANDDHPGVTNLNARSQDGVYQFMPMSKVIG